jgi:ATP-dependent DNA helicase 2 subunit 1
MSFAVDKMTQKKVVFSAAEATALKSFAGKEGRGLRLVGFQERSTLLETDNLREALLVYPFDKEIGGSVAAFAALWQTLIERDMVAIVRYVRTDGSAPKFMALLPERERTSEAGEQEMPPCMYAITLPFAEDQREVDAAKVDTGAAAAAAAQPELASAARSLVSALLAPEGYDLLRSPPANPLLQTFYAKLEGAALNLKPEEMPALRDESMPDAAALSEAQLAAIQSFKASVGSLPVAAAAPAASRKRAAGAGSGAGAEEGGAEASSKKPRVSALSEAEWRALASEPEQLRKKTVEELKGALASFGCKLSGKKEDLVMRLQSHFFGGE